MEVSDSDLQHIVTEREATVDGLIGQGKTQEALKESLRGPPHAAQDPAIKDQAAATVARVLATVKAADVKKHVAALDQNDQDTLMKYIFKNLATGENCNVLLVWHEQLKTEAGIGCIVRAISEQPSIL
eukprot:TRINITY_DN1111_c0_g1_i1.p1 TRINITY_DN1111_c0_g1~~TRINITY_DN1111_c0_g1_i1.p1  ORF type:complete len:137 (+),score=35.48 TRINITY_DN1111_c0_g1_i1:30-413(+)